MVGGFRLIDFLEGASELFCFLESFLVPLYVFVVMFFFLFHLYLINVGALEPPLDKNGWAIKLLN